MTSGRATAIAAGVVAVFVFGVLGCQYFSVNHVHGAVSEGVLNDSGAGNADKQSAGDGAEQERNIQTPPGEQVPTGLVLEEDVGDLQIKAYVNDKEHGSVLQVWQDKEHPVRLFQLHIDNDVYVSLKKIPAKNSDEEPTALIPLLEKKAEFLIIETSPVVARKYQANVLVIEQTKNKGLESVSLLGVLPESIAPLELSGRSPDGPYKLVVRPDFAQMTGASAVDQKVLLKVVEETRRKDKDGRVQNAVVLDWTAMRAASLSKKALSERAASVEAAFSSFSALPMGAESEEQSTAVQDPQSIIAQVPVELTETVLGLYCSGQGDEVKSFLDKSWPAERKGKNEFLTAIKSLAEKDKLWSEVLAGPGKPRKMRLL